LSKHSQLSSHRRMDVDHVIDSVCKMLKDRSARVTGVRRDVIAFLSSLKTPLGAYQILAEMNKQRKPKLSAMSLYRILDFLIELGVVVKVESRNAYQLCAGHDHDHSHLMMICDSCGGIQEIDDCSAEMKLQSLAQKYGHTLKHNVVELHGVCADCKCL